MCFKFLIERVNKDGAVVLVNTTEYLKRLPCSTKILMLEGMNAIDLCWYLYANHLKTSYVHSLSQDILYIDLWYKGFILRAK